MDFVRKDMEDLVAQRRSDGDNDGEMMFAFYNLSNEPITIEKGYCMGQGIFQKYYITDNDNAEGERKGGFGSTSN